MTQIAKIVLTDNRTMSIELMPQHAPISVANFIELAKSGFYSGLIFHRVIPNFMIQAGGMDVKMNESKKKIKEIKGEFRANGVPNDLSHTSGVISMARTMVKDSASSQFFICVTNTPHLDGQYAAFGRTIDEESLRVAIAISGVSTTKCGGHSDVPLIPIIIERIEIVEV